VVTLLTIRRVLLASAAAALASSAAAAQTLTPDNPAPRPIQVLSAPAPAPPPSAPAAAVTWPAAPAGPAPTFPPPTASATLTTAPPTATSTAASSSGFTPSPYALLSPTDRQTLQIGLAAARRGDAASARTAMASLADPAARKLVLWAMVDADGEAMPFYELDRARRDLAGWPRAARRQMVTERAIATADLAPQQVVAWFAGSEPTTAQGALALAGAYAQLNRSEDAANLVRRWWRTQLFDEDTQRAIQTRFGADLSAGDIAARIDALLYGPQGPALHDLLPLAPADLQAEAEARIALRDNAHDALALADALPASVANDPGVAFERARYLHDRDEDSSALALVDRFPRTMPADAAEKSWTFRRQLINVALRGGDYRAAYQIAATSALPNGVDYAEAEFYAGWLALAKLHQPQLADAHFANIQNASSTPITQARAYYWRGRAAEALGDRVQAQAFYGEGAKYLTTFYGQLAAEKAGLGQIVLGRDPTPTPTDRANFERRDMVRAVRMLADLDERETFRAMVLAAADDCDNPVDAALVVDLARAYGDQDLAMRSVRLAAQHGVVLPERGYPVLPTSSPPGSAEPAMVFGVTRVESGFDPHVHSGAGAWGMMQLLPATAAGMARKLGEPYSPTMLTEAGPNMRLGAYYLGRLIDDFGGSYVLAAAAYNAGPGRPAEWMAYCGDPRSPGADPVDFIECIPFSETRSYVMRVLEGAEVYRARLNGGVASVRLAEDLKRGVSPYARVAGPEPTLAAAPTAAPTPR